MFSKFVSAHRIEGKADMHPVGVAGRNVNAAKIILAVADGDAELQVAKNALPLTSRWRNREQTGRRIENLCIASRSPAGRCR